MSSFRCYKILDYTDGYIERIHGRNYPRQVCYDTVYIISNWSLSENKNNPKQNPPQRVYIIKESYEGVKKLSDIFAELLYSAYKDTLKSTDKKCS